MPAASIFPERRTRSQLTLPDTVLAIPERSPLKIAKSRNTMPASDKDAVVEDSEGEDELVLSPSRTKTIPPVVVAEASKRSASPPPEDEYAQGSSDGRHLKRRKRDAGDEDGMSKDADVDAEAETEVEPRRSARKKYTPSNRKPVSTVSASPPPTAIHSPAPVNGRAQSVPLFPSADELSRTDLPRLDLAKLLRSPKRKRSRSRSPVKDTEPKLRMTNVGAAAIPFRLPTIHDGIATGSGSGSGSLSDGESSVPEEREMEMPTPTVPAPLPPQSSSPVSPTQPGGGNDDVASSSSSPVMPATPAATTAISTVALDKTMPMSPLTPVPPTPFPPIRKRAAYTRSRLGMLTAEHDEDDDSAGPLGMKGPASGAGASSSTVAQQGPSSIAIGATTTSTTAIASTSRLPPSQSTPSMFMAPPAHAKSNGQPSGSGSGSGQPPGPSRNTNNSNSNTKKPAGAAFPSSSSMPALATSPFNPLNSIHPRPKPKGTNAFELLMAGSKAKSKGKAVAAITPSSSSSSSLLPSSSSGVGPSFAPVVARPAAGDGANGNSGGSGNGKLKLKDRMRKRQAKEGAERERGPVIEALPEEEEEVQGEGAGGVAVGDMVVEEQEREAQDEEAGQGEAGQEPDEGQDQAGLAADAPSPLRESPPGASAVLERQELELGQDAPRAVVVDAEADASDARARDGDVDMEDVPLKPQDIVSEHVEGAGAGPIDAPEDDEQGDGLETRAAEAPGPSVKMEGGAVVQSHGKAAASGMQQSEEPPVEADSAQMHVEEESHTDDVAMSQSNTEAKGGAGVDESRPPAEKDVPANPADVEPDHEHELDEDLDAPPAKQSKTLAMGGKKRAPTTMPLPTRVTRSSSTRKPAAVGEGDGVQTALAGPSRKQQQQQPQPKLAFKAPLKRTASGKVKLPEPAVASSSREDGNDDREAAGKGRPQRPRTPGSPMKISTPRKAAPVLSKDVVGGGTRSAANTPVAKRAQRSPSPRRPASSPSPMKVSRMLPEYTPLRPSAGITRTFSTSQIFSRPGSSLSQLSSALQKLHQPAPARPSTSMGFNPDAGGETDNDSEVLTTKDDAAVGQRKSIGLGRTGSSVSQRAATLGSDVFKSSASGSSTATTATTVAAAAGASSSKLTRPTASSQAKLVQKRLPFGPGKTTAAGGPRFGTAAMRGRPVGGGAGTSRVRPLFGVGGGLRRTASKKSSLPVVIGSPVKGGSGSNPLGEGTGEGMREEDEEEEEGGEIFNTIMNTGGSATTLLTNLLAQQPERDRERDAHKPPSHSRRVSMLSRDLLEAATALPPPPPPPPSSASQTALAPMAGPSGSGSGGKGLMGPPPTPPSVASVRSTSDSGSPSTGTAKRSSARIAKTAAVAAAAAAESSVAAGKRRAMDPPPVPNTAAEALQVLNECVIFVDVKTDEGDEAGTLFVDMLGTLGARVAAGVGQRCTHIVFKNGLSSTTNKYRALRDPKPHVVSIGWVVACAEQRRRVPEAEYLVDLEFANILGANKRRRASAFHKLLTDPTLDYSESAERGTEDATEDGDRSMDGSVSSITMEDDGLAPLERARRRKSMMIGLNH